MSSWAERAKARFSQERQNLTDKTDERGVSSVSSVLFGGIGEITGGVSSVSSVPPGHKSEKSHSDLVAANDPPTPKKAQVPDERIVEVTLPGNDIGTTEVVTHIERSVTAARLARFTDKGVGTDDGKALANKLVARDRDLDDRRLCLECQHLGGYGRTSWRCGNWQRAGVALRQRDAQLPVDLVLQLQRCDGFSEQQLTQKATT